MGNLRDIRRRIKSVKNTSQITRAMQMVASAKMRRAQDQAVKGRPYIRALAEVLYHLQDEIDTSNSPLMQTHGGADLVLLVNTDRGLCGGLNANLIKMVREQAPENAHYITIGRKLNAALAEAHRMGMRFDSWDEHFDYEKWLEVFASVGIDPSFYANREFGEDEILPWDNIDIGVDKKFLLRERHRAHEAIPTKNCREACNGCGADKLGGERSCCPSLRK